MSLIASQPFQNQKRRRVLPAPAFGSLGLALLLTLPGCLSRPSLQKELFLVTALPATKAAAPRFDGVLGLDRVSVSPQFQGRPLIYRTAENAYELDPYAELLVEPEQMMGAAVRAWFRQSGLFRDVAEEESLIPRTHLGEVHVTEFYGDFRSSAPPSAVLRLQFVLSSAGDSGGRQVSLSRDYARAIALKERTASAVIAGWNQALHEILTELSEELVKKYSR